MKIGSPGKKALRWLSYLIVLWLVAEVIRVYYSGADLDRFLKVAYFLIGPWFGLFVVAAGGPHLKRWTESLKAKAEAVKNGLQGLTG
jgi:hypothetical protein